MIRALDSRFAARVRETSTGLAAIGMLGLAVAGTPLTTFVSFGVGFGLATLVWWAAEVVGTLVLEQPLRGRRAARAAGLYFGKYAVAILALWLLARHGWLEPIALSAGFSLPMVVVLLKALAWQALPDGVDPVPFYSRWRRRDGAMSLDEGEQLG